jgi:proteic killer suppression protein
MIKSDKDAVTAAVARRERVRRFPADIQRRAQATLMMLNSARSLDDLRVPPGNRLEALSGGRKGLYSIRVSDRWRICFSWRRGDAYDVGIVDYR